MSKMCKQCNVKIEGDTKFCPQCGTNQEDNEDATMPKNNGFVPTIEVSREGCLLGGLFNYFIGGLISYKVFVDGTEIGKIKIGEKKQFQIPPGLHEIYIKQNWTWCYSPKVSFLLKDFVKFSCKPKIGFWGALFGKDVIYMIFKRHKYISLKEV